MGNIISYYVVATNNIQIKKKEGIIMGKAQKIADLEKDNKEFQAFMKQLEESMTTDAEKYVKEFENESKDFYKDDYENVVTIESKNHRDYQFEAEFSTERIAQIITTTSNEVFGIQEGETGEIVTALGNYKSMATNVAIHFLTNVLASLTWGQTAEYRYNIQHVSIGPGLTLHALIVEKYYDGSTFFAKKKIVQNYIIYKLCFSKTLAKTQADIEYLNNRLNEMQKSETTYNMIYDKWIALLISDDYIAEGSDVNAPKHLLEASYQRILTQLTIARDGAYNAIAALVKQQENANRLLSKPMNSNIKNMAIPNALLLEYLGKN